MSASYGGNPELNVELSALLREQVRIQEEKDRLAREEVRLESERRCLHQDLSADQAMVAHRINPEQPLFEPMRRGKDPHGAYGDQKQIYNGRGSQDEPRALKHDREGQVGRANDRAIRAAQTEVRKTEDGLLK